MQANISECLFKTSKIWKISMISAISNQPAQDLFQLLALYDKYFVQCAYLTLLGRMPDPEGLQTYCAQLRLGERKMAIISQLRQSAEGKLFAVELPGLPRALAAYKMSRRPVIGKFYLALKKADGDRAYDRKLRSMENAIYANSYEMLDKIERLGAMINARGAGSSGSIAGMSALQDQIHKVVRPAKARPAKGGFVPA